jgi:hypothetical protein
MVEKGPNVPLNTDHRTHFEMMLGAAAANHNDNGGMANITQPMWDDADALLEKVTSANQQTGLAIFSKDLIYKVITSGLRGKHMQDLVRKEECKKTGLQKIVRLLAQMQQTGNKMENAPVKNSIPNAGRVSQIEQPAEEFLEDDSYAEINAFANAGGRGKGGQRGGRGGRGNGRGNHNKGGNQQKPPPQNQSQQQPQAKAQNSSKAKSGACHFCSQEGHWMQNCPIKQQMMTNLPRVTNVGPQSPVPNKGQQGHADHAGFNGFYGSGNWNSVV